MRASLEERPLGTLVASLNMLRRCRNRGELASAAVAQITRTHAGCEAVLGVAANWLLQLTHHQRRITSDLNSIHLVYFSIFSRISIHFWQLKLSKRYTFYFGLYARYRAVYRTALAATQAQVCMRCRHTSFAVLNPPHGSHSGPYLLI